MVLNKFLISILLSCFINLATAAELAKLSTKQAINNLRFISHDGKFTYFQRRSGTLLLSTNYKAIEVVKGSLGSQFTMIGSSARKKLIISQDPYFNTFYGVRHNLRIYQVGYGDSNSKEIGVGLYPAIHLNDTWASFYDSHLKSIFYKNLASEALNFKIILGNSLNPYFIPQTIMASEDQILFTDINNQGIPGVVLFNRKNNSTVTFYKAQSYNSKVEICSNETSFFIGVFGLNRTIKGSSIIKFEKKNLIAEKGETIYTNNRNDIGQMVCNFDNESIYFIKNFSSDKKEKIEIAELVLANHEVKALSNVIVASSLVQMDGLLLLPFRGEYFILKGNANLINDSILVNPKMPSPIELKLPTPQATPAPTPLATPTATATPASPSKENIKPEKTLRPELPGLK